MLLVLLFSLLLLLLLNKLWTNASPFISVNGLAFILLFENKLGLKRLLPLLFENKDVPENKPLLLLLLRALLSENNGLPSLPENKDLVLPPENNVFPLLFPENNDFVF